MQVIKTLVYTLSLLLNLTACNNALYFYETDKVSLTLEARPDSSQPVQGNFGLKQRIALTSPRISEGKDAVSSLVSFRFIKEARDRDILFDFGDVTIKTAFITGEAATSLGNNAVNAAVAIVGAKPLVNINVHISMLTNIQKLMKADTTNQQAQDLLIQLNQMGQVIVPVKYPVTIYEPILDVALGVFELKEQYKQADVLSINKNLDGIYKYLGQLRSGENTLKLVLQSPSQYRLNGSTLSDPISIAGITLFKDKIESELLKTQKKLVNNPIYIAAVEFYKNNYI